MGALNLLQGALSIGCSCSVVLAFLLDLAIYLQHVLFHAVPLSGACTGCTTPTLDFDVTTGLRFHPVEIILSMLIKFAVIGARGAGGRGAGVRDRCSTRRQCSTTATCAYRPLDRILRWSS